MAVDIKIYSPRIGIFQFFPIFPPVEVWGGISRGVAVEHGDTARLHRLVLWLLCYLGRV